MRKTPSFPLRPLTRRQFVYRSALALGGVVVTAKAGAQPKPKRRSPNEKLNIAVIGAGGRGSANISEADDENIVALCDVNELNLNKAAAKLPQARKYIDFRKLYDESKDIDAVMVCTTEHTHAFAVLPAILLGKHVYCEKPLAHTVWEARLLAEKAAAAKVTTQMGSQMHATDNFRRVVELIQSGAVGAVREVHVWVSRAWGDGERPQERAGADLVALGFMAGTCAAAPLSSQLHQRPAAVVKSWDFGGGTLPDLGSHWNDLPFWALKLRHPLSVEAQGPPVSQETAPASFQVAYEYGARGEKPPLKLTWYQGTNKPSLHSENKIPPWENGVLFIGDKGLLLSDYHKHQLLPEEKFADFKRPEPFIPKSIGHWKEWIDACKTGKPTTCNFDYSGALTEANQLGNVAYRTGRKLEWDPVKLAATNCSEASGYLRTDYRKGWTLG